MKKKIGRPLTSEPKELHTLRFTAREWVAYGEVAAASKLDRSTWIRATLNRALARKLKAR